VLAERVAVGVDDGGAAVASGRLIERLDPVATERLWEAADREFAHPARADRDEKRVRDVVCVGASGQRLAPRACIGDRAVLVVA
jgi:hypothetical protein